MEEYSLNGALSEIQRELNAPKSQYNSFGKYAYRSCEDILSAVKPLLAKYDLTIVLSDSIVPVGDRYYVEATARISDGKSAVTNKAYAREDETKKGMDGAQITGTASSYARKYALNGLLAIDDNKDADTDEHVNIQKNAAKKDAEKPVVVCPNCGKTILRAKIKGVMRQPEEILEACGGVCLDCYKETKAKQNKNVKQNAVKTSNEQQDFEEVIIDD